MMPRFYATFFVPLLEITSCNASGVAAIISVQH
jgi:hypothetical protein